MRDTVHVRDAVRQELVARQLDEQIAARFPVGQRLRVLDVGMGRGVQALRLARAGHSVTGRESDAELLGAARATHDRESAYQAVINDVLPSVWRVYT
nr:hypothetical protein [Streptomyces sp. DSM 41633]